MYKKILISTAFVLSTVVSSTDLFGSPITFGDNSNTTNYEIKGLEALYEIADLANHIPESYTISTRSSNDVRNRIVGFSLRGADKIAAGGFVSIFLDLIENDQAVGYLLKNIDLRINMLRKSSTNYTSVLEQYLVVTDPTWECLSRYLTAVQTTAQAVHNLYAYAQAKVSGANTQTVYEKLQAFRNVCD